MEDEKGLAARRILPKRDVVPRSRDHSVAVDPRLPRVASEPVLKVAEAEHRGVFSGYLQTVDVFEQPFFVVLRVLKRLQGKVRAVPLHVIDAAEYLVELDRNETRASRQQLDSLVTTAGNEQVAAEIVRCLRIGSEDAAAVCRGRPARTSVHFNFGREIFGVVTGHREVAARLVARTAHRNLSRGQR